VWAASVSWKEPPLASQLAPASDREIKGFGEISVVRLLAQAQ